MRLEKIVDSNFSAAMTRLVTNNIPIKAAFKLRKIVTRVDEELSRYHETRKEYLKKYAELDDDGNLVPNEAGGAKLTDENSEAFLVELNELLQLEVDVGTVSIDELGDISMTTMDLIHLDGVVV